MTGRATGPGPGHSHHAPQRGFIRGHDGGFHLRLSDLQAVANHVLGVASLFVHGQSSGVASMRLNLSSRQHPSRWRLLVNSFRLRPIINGKRCSLTSTYGPPPTDQTWLIVRTKSRPPATAAVDRQASPSDVRPSSSRPSSPLSTMASPSSLKPYSLPSMQIGDAKKLPPIRWVVTTSPLPSLTLDTIPFSVQRNSRPLKAIGVGKCGAVFSTRKSSLTSTLSPPLLGLTATQCLSEVTKPHVPKITSPAMIGEAIARSVSLPKHSISQRTTPVAGSSPVTPCYHSVKISSAGRPGA